MLLTSICDSEQGNIIVETNSNISADTSTSCTPEMTTALDSLHIMVGGIYANRRRMQYVIHGVLSHIRNTNCKELRSKMTEDINYATGSSLVQPPGWINSEIVLKNQLKLGHQPHTQRSGSGGHQGAQPFQAPLPLQTRLPFHSSSTHAIKAKPSATKKYTGNSLLNVVFVHCRPLHVFYTCTTTGYPGGNKCRHTSISCANCPSGPSTNDTAMDQACPHSVTS